MPQPATAGQALTEYVEQLGRLKPMATDGPSMRDMIIAGHWVVELAKSEGVSLHELVADDELRADILEDAGLYEIQTATDGRHVTANNDATGEQG